MFVNIWSQGEYLVSPIPLLHLYIILRVFQDLVQCVYSHTIISQGEVGTTAVPRPLRCLNGGLILSTGNQVQKNLVHL